MMRRVVLFLLLGSPLFGASVTITSPTPGQIAQSIAPFKFTATTTSAPTGYSMEWKLDNHKWATGYAKRPYPDSNDFRDAWIGPYGVTWYPGYNGDGPHFLTAILRDIFGVVLASTTVNFSSRVEGMGNQSISPAVPVSGNQSDIGFLGWDGGGGGLAVDGVPWNSSGLTIIDDKNNVYNAGWVQLDPNPNIWQVYTATQPVNVFFQVFTGGIPVASTSALTTYSDWYWNNNILYAYIGPSGAGASCHSNPDATTQSGGSYLKDFDTTCWPNGQHEVLMGWLSNGLDPYVQSEVFVSSDVVGNNITVPRHAFQNGNAIVFLTTATLPAPLIAGTQWFWTTSPTASSTTALSIAGGIMTITCSGPCGASPGSFVNIMNVESTSLSNGQPNCDGLFPVATVWTTSFTVVAPATCPNGAQSNLNLEVDVNPYFALYVDSNTIAVSATPGGSTITLTTSGTGFNTIQTRMRAPYYTASGNNGEPNGGTDIVAYGAPANVIQNVTFANGTTPMELRPPYWEVHGIVGGGTVSVCPSVMNTDLTTSTLSCNGMGVGYKEVDDGGKSGVCSVDTSGNISFLSPGWCQVQVSCSGCAAKTASLRTVTVYAQSHAGSITFPHFTRSGPISTSYTPGSSFFPIGMWNQSIVVGTDYNNAHNQNYWYGPMMQQSNLNSALTGLQNGMGRPSDIPQSGCSDWTSTTTIQGNEEWFANKWNISIENDFHNAYFVNQDKDNQSDSVAAILSNLQYDRKSCLQSLVSHHVSTGHYWRYFNDDEITDVIGAFLQPNTLIGGVNFTNAVVLGGTITFNVQNINPPGQWVQSTGAGNWIRISSATNSCLNGWYPINGVFTSSWTSVTSCANGTYAPSGGTIAESSATIVLGQETLQSMQNTSILPTNLSADQQYFTGVTYQGQGIAASVLLSSITCNSGLCTVHYVGNGINNGQAIRIWGATSANLNIVSSITVVSVDTFTITYPNKAGELAPANGTYTNVTDPNLYITIDPNWGPNPFGQIYALVDSVSNHPAVTWAILGNLFSLGNSTGIYSYEGDPTHADAAFDYVPTSPSNTYGDDGGVWQWMNYSQASSGLVTRAYQMQPRAVLATLSPQAEKFSRSIQAFNPATDRPQQLSRPEDTVAQTMGYVALGMSAFRYYTYSENVDLLYSNACCGWNSGGSGTGDGGNPNNTPKQWQAIAHSSALAHMLEPNILQPNANKPYLGPMFITDAHTSATYGNEVMVLCGDQLPYGQITINLPQISGGTTLKYVLTGYSLSTSIVPGNPATDTEEFCKTPGQTTVFVSQPPGFTMMDYMNFSPPASLPYGASKYLIQVGYYPKAMMDDPVTDCSSSCTIPIQHYKTNAYYRVIYADSNSLPLSVGDPQMIAATSP